MPDHRSLGGASARSRKFQSIIRQETFAPEETKTLRRFSTWEVTDLILNVNPKTFGKKLRGDAGMPVGETESGSGGMKWFSLDEISQIRGVWRDRGKQKLNPERPENARALRTAVANFKGGAGKSTVALHFAHAAALDGYKVLVIDFDPQATLSHAMGLVDVPEEQTVWGIIAQDLMIETRRMNAERRLRDGSAPQIPLPPGIEGVVSEEAGHDAFITGTCWPTIDAIGSCANAAFVEFATAEYRTANRGWSFFAAVDRFLDTLPNDRYDMIIFDCPPAIGYQSLNAVFAADLLYVPTGPGYWEYDSTTSFLAQLSEALGEVAEAYADDARVGGSLPKNFEAVRILLTRVEPSNELHRAMRGAMTRVFGDWLTEHSIEHTRAVEQTGRFQRSIYEMDYRQMTRETWKRARRSFDAAYAEFKSTAIQAWRDLPQRGSACGTEKETAA
jgi:cellulose biosynthesis protein BcsQ